MASDYVLHHSTESDKHIVIILHILGEKSRLIELEEKQNK